jgi:hypothetical protein
MRRGWALAAAVLLTGCAPGVREAQPFEGIWTSDGFAIYLDVHGGNADIYEHSPVHCALVYGGSARGISDVLSLDQGRLVLDDSGRVVHFNPIAALPEACGDDSATDDAARIVTIAGATMEELYHRPRRGMAWPSGWTDTGTADN